MHNTLIKNVSAGLPQGKKSDLSILVKDGLIKCVGDINAEYQADTVIDLKDLTLYPGFIDIHLHGAVGVDTNQATKGDFENVARFLARNGVTGWLPTRMKFTEPPSMKLSKL